MKATKSLIMSIIHNHFQGGEFTAHQIQNILYSKHDIKLDIDCVSALLHAYNEIVAIEPRDRKISRAWTYKIKSLS